MIFLTVLLWLFLILLLLLVLIIVAPFTYRVEGSVGEHTDVTARFSWFFWLFRVLYTDSEVTVKIGPYTVPEDKISGAASSFIKTDADEDKKPPDIDWRMVLTNLDKKSIISLGIILLKKLFRQLAPRQFFLSGVVGFGNPGTTGLFLGACQAVLGKSESIHLQGDFCESRFEMVLKMNGYFSIASLLWPCIWFYFQKPVRDAVKLMKRGKSNEQ